MRLSHREFNTLQEAILQLYDYRELEVFRQAMPGIFLKAFPAEYFLWNTYRIDLPTKRVVLLDCIESPPRLNAVLQHSLERAILSHPFTQYFLSRDGPTAPKVSDFFSMREFRKTSFSQETHRFLGLDRTMSVAVQTPPGTAAALNLSAQGRDFTERDRLMLNLIRPHFDQAHRNAKLASASRRVSVQSTADYRLTPRELSVARWVAQGKTNPEIATILQIRRRTIEKHMERILQKLGAENRTAAALMIAKAEPAQQLTG